jgi:hypothetical protein
MVGAAVGFNVVGEDEGAKLSTEWLWLDEYE